MVKRTGDGLFAEFLSVVDAMRCAVEVRNAMRVSGLGWSPASPLSAWFPWPEPIQDLLNRFILGSSHSDVTEPTERLAEFAIEVAMRHELARRPSACLK